MYKTGQKIDSERLIHLLKDKIKDKQSKKNLFIFILLAAAVITALSLQVNFVYKSISSPVPRWLTILYAIVPISLSLLLFLKIDFSKFKVGKAIIVAIFILAAIEAIYANFLKNIKTYIAMDTHIESDETYSIQPGQTWDTIYDTKGPFLVSLDFFIEGKPADGLAIKLVSEESGSVFFDRQIDKSEFTQDEGMSIISISTDMINDEFDVLPAGVYHIYFTNTNARQEIKISVIASEDTNPQLNVSSYTVSMGGYQIAFFLFLLMMIYMVMIYTYNMDKEIKPETFFLLSVIPLSAAYLVLMTPLSVPDAGAHFSAAYRFSNILLNKEPWGGRIDDINFFQNINNHYPNTRDFLLIKSNISLWAKNTELTEWPHKSQNMEYYSIFCYLPQVLGLYLGRLLRFGSVLTVYLSRLCMLIAYIFSCYNAIKKTPIGKFIFAAILLLPTSLMMSSAISYDSLVLICTLNFLACSLRLYHEPESRSALIECIIWAFFVGAVKGGGYLVLLPIVFIFIYPGKKHTWFKTAAIIGSGLASVLLFDVILPAGTKLFQFGGEKSDKLYASYALEHPLKYLEMVFETYLVQPDLLIQMGGTGLAWLEYTLPSLVIVGFMLVIGIYSIYEEDYMQLNNKDKNILLFTIFLVFFLTPVMLLSWTSAESDVIQGLQGRYYLPVFPLMIIVITKFKLHIGNNGEKTEPHRQEISRLCYHIYALLSCLSIYYMMRLYLTR